MRLWAAWVVGVAWVVQGQQQEAGLEEEGGSPTQLENPVQQPKSRWCTVNFVTCFTGLIFSHPTLINRLSDKIVFWLRVIWL